MTKARQMVLFPDYSPDPYYSQGDDPGTKTAIRTERELCLESAAWTSDHFTFIGWLLAGRYNVLLDKRFGWRIYGGGFSQSHLGSLVTLRGGKGYGDRKVAFFRGRSYEEAVALCVRAVRANEVNWKPER